MLQNLANYRRVFDKGDDVHRGKALGTNQWGYQIDFFDELSTIRNSEPVAVLCWGSGR